MIKSKDEILAATAAYAGSFGDQANLALPPRVAFWS